MNFKQFLLESELKYTKEMSDWFNERTNKHISLVQKYAKLIENKFHIKGLIEQAKDHDKSKFEDNEYIPYVFLSWNYHCKDIGKEFNLSDDIKTKTDEAWKHHYTNNSHHPEYFKDITKMTNLDIAEMCADWLAMSEERGNSAVDWADKNVGTKWKFNDKQKDLIYKILNGIEDK